MRGHGVKAEEVTTVWKTVAALIQSKERREMSEVICFFTFLCAWNWARNFRQTGSVRLVIGHIDSKFQTYIED